MGDHLFFSKLITKDLTAVDSTRRLFEGVLTVEMKDRQGEITVRDELLKVLPIWIARGGPITDTHSNRVVGKGINYAATTVTDSDGKQFAAITIQGEIFKDYELDNEIWDSIKTGKYKGLSFGGATKSDRTPILEKDGSVAYALKDLEQYEVAVCEEPAVPLAIITQHNAIAKAMAGNTVDRGNGNMCIRCDKFKCYIDKNGEDFSDNKGPNIPQKDPKAEALEADRSQGANQENGATYRGTDKGRSVVDSARYAENETVSLDNEAGTPKVKDNKAMDEDDDEMLDRAGLEEEKKLEYAKGDPEGPITKDDTNNPGGKQYDQTNAAGDKTDKYGNKIPKVMSKKPKQTEEQPKGRMTSRVSEGSKIGNTVETHTMSPKDLRRREARIGIGEGAKKKPGAWGKTIIGGKQIQAKSLDLLSASFSIKAGINMVKPLRGGDKYPGVKNPIVPDKMKPSKEMDNSSTNPKKENMQHGSLSDASRSNFEANHLDPEVADKLKTDYNTCEVVREYCDDSQKKSHLDRRTRKYSFDEVQAILEKLLKSNHEQALHDRNGTSDFIHARHFVTTDGRITRHHNDSHEEQVRSLGHKDLPSYLKDTGSARVTHDDKTNEFSVHTHKPMTSHQERTIRNHMRDNKISEDKVIFDNFHDKGPGETGESHAHHSKVFPKGNHNNITDNVLTDKAEKYPGLEKKNELQAGIDSNSKQNPGVKTLHDEFQATMDKKIPLSKVPDTKKPGSISEFESNSNHDSARGGQSYDREIADRFKTDYNTCEVVREYCDEKNKMAPHFVDEHGDTWYAYKTNSVNTFTGEPGGGNFGREPGITRDDESKSPQEAIQPKHVNATTDEKGAKGLEKEIGNVYSPGNAKFDAKNPQHKQELGVRWKDPANTNKPETVNVAQCGHMSDGRSKAYGDPQMEANNSEDGVNRKIRLDNDPPAEAMSKDKSTPVDGGSGGAGGVRAGAAYDTAQQDTGQKDNPRKTEERPYSGEEDESTGVSNSKFNKSIILNKLNLDLKSKLI